MTMMMVVEVGLIAMVGVIITTPDFPVDKMIATSPYFVALTGL